MIAKIYTTYGPITIELVSGRCEATVRNFARYVDDGFYAGTLLHRVVDGYVLQGGGFERGMIRKTTRPPIRNESARGLRNTRGTIAMARRPDDPDSATAQFFINLEDNASLDHGYADGSDPGYCAFGRVTDGMRVVETISKIGTRTIAGNHDVPIQEVVVDRIEATG